MVFLECEVLQNMAVTIVVNKSLEEVSRTDILFSRNQHLLLDKPRFHIFSQSHFFCLHTKTEKLKNNETNKICKMEPNSEYNRSESKTSFKSVRILGMTRRVTRS